MKSAIVFIAFLITVFIVIFLFGLLLPSKVTVTKSIEINASAFAVKQQITDFSNWKNWYPAFKDAGTSVVKSQLSNNLNSVKLKDINRKEIILILADSTSNEIKINVESSSPTKVNYQFIVTPQNNGHTELTWNINTQFGWYPWKRIQGIFLDKFTGDQYVAALAELKNAAEH